jgi:dipeptidyl aminopeptidase/acylaminoacyl peptidase
MFDARWVSLSPDGHYLTYASACTGHGDIYVIKSGATKPIRLTDSEDFESSPMFTPDGKRIVFVREHDQRRHVWIMDSDGSHATQLTQGSTLDYPLYLSRDGRFLLFSSAKPSIGLGLTARSFVMRVDERDDKPTSVGDLAVFSGDSLFVVYSESGELWRMELDEKRGTRRRIHEAGQPLDVSGDGKLVLTARLPPEAQWSFDQEIWVVNLETNSEKQLATGHSAVFFGPKNRHVLFFVGHDQIPYVTAIDGATPTRIECAPTYKTWPRVCLDGRGAVLGASLRNGQPEYDVIFIDFQNRRATTIASLGCDNVTFQAPSTIKRDK